MEKTHLFLKSQQDPGSDRQHVELGAQGFRQDPKSSWLPFFAPY